MSNFMLNSEAWFNYKMLFEKICFPRPCFGFFLSLCEYLYTKLYHAFMYKYSDLKLIHYCICVPGCKTMGVTEEQTRNELR